MKDNSDDLGKKLHAVWGAPTATVIEKSVSLLAQLHTAELGELYRDPEFGFILTAYAEVIDQYRAPHNHGKGWVIYMVLEGAMEMRTFLPSLDLEESITMRSGDLKVYLPGEIHDTRCLTERALILRLTSCDLKVEEEEGRMKRFTVRGPS